MLKFYTYITILMLIGSCAHEGHEWQDKVVFTKEGGETTITGKSGASWHIISNDSFPDEYIEEGEEIIQREDWLTIRCRKGYSKYLILKAEPMVGNNIRKLVLETTGAYNRWEDITVIQYPKDSVQLGLKPKP
ncbi:MAG: hypothetical protein ACI3Y2_03565 [Candidatus Egerieousia sp.]